MSSLFKKDIIELKGVGSVTAPLFRLLGVNTLGSLLYFYPRKYEDWTCPCTIHEFYINPNGKCIKLKICSRFACIPIDDKRTIYKANASDGQNYIKLIFFNNRFIENKLKLGTEFLLMGNVFLGKEGNYEVICPKIEKTTPCSPIRPIYPQSEGLPSWKIERSVKNVLAMLPSNIRDTLPLKILQKYDLCSLKTAILNIHFPKCKELLEKAKRRLAFEQILIMQLSMLILKKRIKTKTDICVFKNFIDEFYFLLPFNPTHAQINAISECINDMLNGRSSMARLLQGDVGSGKTVVAAALAYNIIKNGFQAAIMVPTELLAIQHFNTLSKIFLGTNINIGLLTGKLKESNRKKIIQDISSGEINLVIGTHAVISDNVEFRSLGLVITDEQHRFGVRQRTRLFKKGKNPHMLIMSATPIPRSLALILYADLDISILDELPPGRQKVKTFSINSSKRPKAFKLLKNILDKGLQGYIVCPEIEECDNPFSSVSGCIKKLSEYGFDKYNTAVIHGKMSSDERYSIMERFVNGQINLLVSTTVIEVGVDVTNASIIIIENAESFGLSQLHQLRGRVGRGGHEAYCILISDTRSPDALKRFQAMKDTNDGFILSNEDLKIRGPGEFFGLKQHGISALTFSSFGDINMEFVNEAKVAAEYIIKQSPDIKNNELKLLRHRVNEIISCSDDGSLNITV